MKYLIVASLLLLCHFGAFSQHDWQWLNPQPSGATCIKITFTDRQHGFILNRNGELIRTEDQGIHWQISSHFPLATAMDIADSTGIIVCSNGVLYMSTDDGDTWNLVSSSLRGNLKWISIISRDTFYLATADGLIYRTTDRGKTMTSTETNLPIISFTFADANTGFIGQSGSMIFKSTDGGQTWIKKDSVNFTPSNILSFQFLNTDTGFAFRESSSLLRTYDGGNTWSEFNTASNVPVFQFINIKTGFIAGGDGVILRTDDSGSTWNSITPVAKDGFQIYSIYFFDGNTGFMVGGLGRILKTTNGGQTWSSYSPTYLPITAVSFPTTLTGYMSDWNNTYKTTDGGQHWDSLSLVTGMDYPSSSRFTQAHFSSVDSGYFLSDNDVREHQTSDGGQTWTLLNPASADWMTAPGEHYIGPHTGFISLLASGNAQLLKTNNDGTNWSTVWQAQFSNEYLGRIFFTDSLHGFALRYQQLMKTTDGGVTWSIVYTDPYYAMTDLCFTDPINGYLTNGEGQVLITHDGGISFTSVNFGHNYLGTINTIRFFNQQIGYLAAGNQFGPGNFGQIYKTIDGGKTWQLNNSFGGNSIIFTPDSNVVIAGFGGELIKNKIRNWQVDSLSVSDDNACGENFSVFVGAALSDVDGISILYTDPGGKTDTVAASPAHVHNALVICKATAKAFKPDVVYTARVRLKYDGVYQLTDPIYFTPVGISQPAIKDSAGYLVSSVDSANHWFRNGIAIPSALGRRYYPDSSGTYRVQTILDSCVSALSDPVTINLACSSKQPVPAPTVTNNAGVLISSASQGNHWFLNGVEIPDAYDQQYTPTVSGDYSARIITACTISPMSNVVNSLVSNPGPGPHIHPNPVVNQLVIDNQDGAPLEFEIMNITGESIITGSSSGSQIYINTRTLSPGQYILRVRNGNTNSSKSVLFVRL
ncbi:MAG TPA: YCF48-related protein [Puia sp.]|nr:YCF48-related protein [Puia sp.]